MKLASSCLALALAIQLVAPAFAGTPARSPRRGGTPITAIRVGCFVGKKVITRPIILIVPAVVVVEISVCLSPRDTFRARGT